MSSPSSTYGMEPLELEELHPRPSLEAQRQVINRRVASSSRHPVDQVWALIRLYLEGHPFVATLLLFGVIGVLLHFLVSAMRRPIARHRISHDYTKINYDYNFRASQMQHWCLFGDDDACLCEDFTDPVPRMERKGWREAHEANQVLAAAANKEYDVVFLGDDTVEMWNGRALNVPANVNPNGRAINQYFNKTFTKAGGGQIEGLALGIYGDSTSNLLWRLQNGEFPSSLHSKIWWVLIGSSDLARGLCSEEATELGILRIAEEIHYHRPYDVIVLQGILPRSIRPDGAVSEKAGLSLFGHSKEYSVETAKKEFVLWPSIVNINKQIEEFCGKHEHTVYFDVSHFFLGTMGNEFYHTKHEEIIKDLMPDFAHPSAEGMTVMGDAIAREVIRIIYDEDEGNDIES